MQMVVDGELNKALGARRMNREIERLADHTIVCGFGRMGSILARELHAAGKPFLVIDTEARRLQEAEDRGYLVLDGDASDEFVLERAGIRRAAVLAAMLSQDATNVFVTITARELNPKLLILARGENPRTERKLLSSGADKVVLPMAIGAAKVAQLIIRPSAESLLEDLQQQASLAEDLGHIGLKFDELTVQAGSPLVGRPLREIEVRSNHGFLIVGVRDVDGVVKLNPSADSLLKQGDVVIVLGQADDMPQLAAKFTGSKEKITYRGATLES
jgi:voltage-gated potassium channel